MEKQTAIIVLIIAVLAISSYVFINLPNENKVISVTGTSELKANPELISIYISVETLDKSAQTSKDKNAEIYDKIFLELIKLGLDKKNIRTENFNVYEEFDYYPTERKSKGWKTVNNIIVKIADFEKAGSIVDIAVNQGGLVHNINFELTQNTQNKLKTQTLKNAAEDARNKAESIAEGSGSKIVDIASITSQDSTYYPYPIYAYAEGSNIMDAKQASTNISPKELTITSTVQAVYKIK